MTPARPVNNLVADSPRRFGARQEILDEVAACSHTKNLWGALAGYMEDGNQQPGDVFLEDVSGSLIFEAGQSSVFVHA